MRNVGLLPSVEAHVHAYFVLFFQEVFLTKWLDQSTSKSHLHWTETCNKHLWTLSVTYVCLSIHRTVADVFNDDEDDNWTQPYAATMWPNQYVSPSLRIFIVIFMFFLENIKRLHTKDQIEIVKRIT